MIHVVVYLVGLILILLAGWLRYASQEENVDNYQHTEAKQERRFRKGCMIKHPMQRRED